MSEYDKALERAKIYYNKDTDRHLRAAIEFIFPEVTDSPDEKIRKEILADYRNLQDFFGHDVSDVKVTLRVENLKEKIEYLERIKALSKTQFSEEDTQKIKHALFETYRLDIAYDLIHKIFCEVSLNHPIQVTGNLTDSL